MPKRIVSRPKCLFGKILLGFLAERGVTQYELADAVGISQAMVANFFRCTKYPSLRAKEEGEKATIVKIADALELDKEERRRLYRARLIMFKEKPIWLPEIVDLLPETKPITREEAFELFVKGLNGKPVTTWAHKHDIADVTALKVFNFLQGKIYAGSIDLASQRRATLSKIVDSLSLSRLEKASLLRFFLQELADPEVVDILTSSPAKPVTAGT